MTPQITGGVVAPGLLTVKVSVRHWVDLETGVPVPVTDPAVARPIETVEVDGPLMVNVLKSNLIF